MILRELRDPRTLRQLLSRQFLGSLLASAQGRAYVLTQAGIAESTDEGAVFEHVSQRVQDPELLRMVRKHAEDEERHAQLFFGCADRQGVPRPEIPSNLRVLERLNGRLGIFDRRVETDRDIMDAYLVLQVVEERAIEQFATIEPVLRRYDARSADVLQGIREDEARHVLYCRAITKRYAPSERARIARLRELREAEAAAFRDHQRSGIRHVLASGYLPQATAFVWRAAADLLERRDVLPYTRFKDEAHGETARAA